MVVRYRAYGVARFLCTPSTTAFAHFPAFWKETTAPASVWRTLNLLLCGKETATPGLLLSARVIPNCLCVHRLFCTARQKLGKGKGTPNVNGLKKPCSAGRHQRLRPYFVLRRGCSCPVPQNIRRAFTETDEP